MPEIFPAHLIKLSVDDRKALLRYVRRLLGRDEGSEDIVQEALLRTYEHRTRVIEPRAFAFTAARNLAADQRRHAQVSKTDSLGDLSNSHVVADTQTVEGGVLAEEENALLREAVERLSPQCRAAFTLRVLHGCSYKEIAQRLGLSPKTVENHIARGLRATNEYLRERYDLI